MGLLSQLIALKRLPDAIGETTLTPEEASKIRSLGFAADPGPWKVPPVPPQLVGDDQLLAQLSLGWTIQKAEAQVIRGELSLMDRRMLGIQQSESAARAQTSVVVSEPKPQPLGEKNGQTVTKKIETPAVLRAALCEVQHLRRRKVSQPGRISPPVFLEGSGNLLEGSEQQPTIIFTDKDWERLRFKGMKLRRWLEQNRPISPVNESPMFRELAWQTFKELSAAIDGNFFAWLTLTLEPQFSGIFERRRPRRPTGDNLFEDMVEPFQSAARMNFERLCRRWRHNLPSWRKAILAGRARWLAVHRPDSAWGRSMRAKRGGYAVQEKYRKQGHHPLGLTLRRKLKP